MRAMYGIFVGVAVLAAVPRLVHSSAISRTAACARLQARVAQISGLPVSGPVGLGWYCEFANSTDIGWFVIALRSGRHCDGICSNLMGWYSVKKSSGNVHEYNVADMSIGAPLEKSK